MMSVSDLDKQTLLKYARFCLENDFGINEEEFVVNPHFIERFNRRYGVFVSLYDKDELRACIGQMTSEKPIYKTLKEATVASAHRDHRFKPVRKREISKLRIEISLLSPMRRINDIEEIVLGKHGIYMEKGGLTGTFLPQVADSQGWNVEEFLGHCAENKAKIGWDGWKDANIYIYETITFKEE